MQLGTCIYINVWWYIHRISLCQLKSYKLVSHFIMRKTFTLYSLPYTKQLLNGDTHIHTLSLSHSVSPFLKSLEIIDLPYLAFQRYDIMPCPHSCFGSCTHIILKLELVISVIERTYSIWYGYETFIWIIVHEIDALKLLLNFSSGKDKYILYIYHLND